MSAPERALITGATGFIGSHLARHLLAGGAEVHVVLRPGAHLDRIPDLADRLVRHEDDGATPLTSMVAEAAPEVTFHVATRFVAQHAAADVPGLVADNIAFPARLADALAEAGHRALVNVGTAWQRAGGATYRPRNLYAATKQAFEDIVQLYIERGQLDVTTIEIHDSYGPRDHRGKVISALISAVTAGEPLSMGSGRSPLDLVHVDDIARALLLAGDRARNREAPARFGASSGEPHTLREVVQILEAVAGRPVPVVWDQRPEPSGEDGAWSPLPSIPGWSPHVTLQEGLAELLGERA